MVDAERACSLASMILIDDDVAVTGDKIMAILEAADIKGIPPFLPPMFASAISGKDPKSLFMQIGGGAAAAPGTAVAGEATDAPAAKEESKKEEKKPESESDEDMGFDLFG